MPILIEVTKEDFRTTIRVRCGCDPMLNILCACVLLTVLPDWSGWNRLLPVDI